MSPEPRDKNGEPEEGLLDDAGELDEFGELLAEGKLPAGDRGLDEISRETIAVDRADFPMPPPVPALAGLKFDSLPKGLKARLVLVAASGEATVFPIEKSLVLLGRVAGVVDLAIEDDAASRHHAAVVFREQRFEVHDLGSTNGTVLNGQRIAVGHLKHGSEIRIGATLVRFEGTGQ